jgi:hypothetical protein
LREYAAQVELTGAGSALSRLAEQLVRPTSAEAAEQAFKAMDTDGSGYLSPIELARALRCISDVPLISSDVRLLLAYMWIAGDKDKCVHGPCGGQRTSLCPAPTNLGDGLHGPSHPQEPAPVG